MELSALSRCPVRKKQVQDTPEERIRRALLEQLQERGFPLSFLLVEKSLAELSFLNIRNPSRRRIDILAVYRDGEQLRPLLVIECKQNKISKKALLQLCGYNYSIGAPFLATCGEDGFMLYDVRQASCTPISSSIPFYADLVKALR